MSYGVRRASSACAVPRYVHLTHAAVRGMPCGSCPHVEPSAPHRGPHGLHRYLVRASTLRSFDELAFRFEEPTSDARWHRPLFTAISSCLDNKLEVLPTPLDEIWAALTQSDVQPPKSVTLVVCLPADTSVKKRRTMAWSYWIPRHMPS